jgi:hypothetical protein
MNIVRNAIYMSIFGAGMLIAYCGRNNNQDEGASDPVEERADSITKTDTDTLHPETLRSQDTAADMGKQMP